MRRFAALAIFFMMFAATALATPIGRDITIFDGSKRSGASSSNGFAVEDGETEPQTIQTQAWDLEGFFVKDSKLSMVGGYNFKSGEAGVLSGDIFFDTNGDVTNVPPTTPNPKFHYGYDYALRFVNIIQQGSTKVSDFTSNLTYLFYQLKNDTKLSGVSEPINADTPSSNPWRITNPADTLYGATLLGQGAFTYTTVNSDFAPEEGSNKLLSGGKHNILEFDLKNTMVDPYLYDLTIHYTMGCGNDNLMGLNQAPVPEPSTFALLGIGGAALLAVRLRKTKED